MVKDVLVFFGLLTMMGAGTYYAPHKSRVGSKLAVHKERMKDIKNSGTSATTRRGSIFYYYHRYGGGGYRGGYSGRGGK